MKKNNLAKLDELYSFQKEKKYEEAKLPGIENQLADAVEDRLERDRHIKENQKLVYSIAWKYMGQGMELSDLIQIGNLGLLKAVKKFDPDKGVQFGSYAYYWIHQTIKLVLNNQGRIIRIPTHILEQIKRYYHTQEILTQKLGREPNGTEISQELYGFDEDSQSDRMKLKDGEISLDEIVSRESERDKKRKYFRELEEILRIAEIPVSLDEPYGEYEENQIYDILPDRKIETPEESFMKQYRLQEIKWLLGYLSERERMIINLRFGLEGEESYSFQKIADLIGITKQGTRKILMKSLDKLKKLQEYSRGFIVK